MKQRTDLFFRKAAPRDTRYEVPDRDGLVLEVHPSGKKTWRYRYRLQGKREKVTLGPYPAISLERARDMRREAERLLVSGTSPAADKRLKRNPSEDDCCGLISVDTSIGRSSTRRGSSDEQETQSV